MNFTTYQQLMLAENLKYLRKKNKLSQQELADTMNIPRTTLGDYERGKTEPNIETLICFASYYGINLDQLLTSDLSLQDFEIIKNEDFRVLAISVDADNNGNIELVDTKAEAGYLESFSDPQYIKDLPKIQFPNIPDGTYRGFEIEGDSMLPMEPGSIVLASYVENLSQIKDNRTYIIVGRSEGLVYKRVVRNESRRSLILMSDNPIYAPYEISYGEVAEIWQYYAHLSFSDKKQQLDNRVEERIIEIQKNIEQMKDLLQN
ncbi:XRE family transcriptional regulator [Portibacter marinus]|uniref:XRE family transcriptional regulator n=1 Tax=Portibacter marinus TaxID=2898660 RepID=UPI001F1C54A8|nr:helix-turn-helix domain-containing protein [Portibacter marinus]